MPATVPQHCATARELDDLELLTSGAYSGRTGFGDAPVLLHLPADVSSAVHEAGALELVDPEGLPLARLEGPAIDQDGSVVGEVRPLATPEYGAFRRLHQPPERVRAEHPDALTVPLAGPPTQDDLDAIREQRGDREVVLLALTGTGTPQGVSPVGLIRACLAAADLLGDCFVIACPFPDHGDPESDHLLGAEVAQEYSAGALLGVPGTGELPEPIARVLSQDGPPERGLVVFFTGLSGSGKSTLARALQDVLLERGERTVTSLDGDVVRRTLSAGLGFSSADRETNIRRIGWVAAEISRHGGVAICSPIAPFDATRKQVRGMVADAGGEFVLVHVATPLEECERRDRKGLYARARAGEITEFTGISSPYEEPQDATVRVDTTGRSVEETLAEVLDAVPELVPTAEADALLD